MTTFKMSLRVVASLLCTIFVRSASIVELEANPCAFVQGCSCVDGDVTVLDCTNIGLPEIHEIGVHYEGVRKLTVANWGYGDKYLDFSVFHNLTALEHLNLINGRLMYLYASDRLESLKTLTLRSNWMENMTQVCEIFPNLPKLRYLDLSRNYLKSIPSCINTVKVSSLNMSFNRISYVNGSFSKNVVELDLAVNQLTVINSLPPNLNNLNISYNPLKEVHFPLRMDNLKVLDMSSTKLFEVPPLNASKLESIDLNDNVVTYADVDAWRAPKLKRISMRESIQLEHISGRLPASLQEFTLTSSKITAFPQNFYSKTKLQKLDLDSNVEFDCDRCVLQWTSPVKNLLEDAVKCTYPSDFSNCSLGVSATQPDIQWAVHGKRTTVSCSVYGDPSPSIEWWLFRPSTYLGSFDQTTRIIDRSNVSEEALKRYSIVGGGALRVDNTDRSYVERYVCVVRNTHGHAWSIVKLRLSYWDWYSLDLFESVFWGALAFCIVICAFSFLLNITWILTRKTILWWIQRAERLSRVRKMVEAMEKYRARQMESLHDKYARRVALVRDNYHQQVEQLRVSYSSQAERFRDYRAAQMESVTSHLENIRDNYQQQMNKVRDYGSRRAEQLWESYERQVNRMRTFSLQHRLKLMRQYKVKQRYLNKLLESFQDVHSPEALRKHEEEVRAALNLPEPEVPDPTNPLSRSSSFYSLPEYVIDEDGQLRPSPLVPAVRFTRESAISPTHSGRDANEQQPSTSTSSK